MTVLQDKKAIAHVFAGLLADPSKLSIAQKYQLKIDDFPETFHKIVYGAMFNLYNGGLKKLNPIEIDGYLSKYPKQYSIYNDNEGLEYLEMIEDLGEPSNFDYHYERVKKYSFLRTCNKSGIDISEFYHDNDLDLDEEERKNEYFNELTLEEMVKTVETRFLQLREDYLFNEASKGSHMADNLKQILKDKQASPTYGYNMTSGYLNTITRGSRKRKLYLTSGNTGSGKTRTNLANVLNACVPEVYDEVTSTWIKTGATGRGLFVSTELEEDEIKIPAICFIANVENDKVEDSDLTFEEIARLERATEILAKTPVWFEEMNDFDDIDLEFVIEKHVVKNSITIVGFDYIHTTLKIFDTMAKRGAKGMQEHQILRIFVTKMKALCNKYDVHISTGTQLNNNFKEEGNFDQSSLAGAKAIADKVDYGALQIPLTKKDMEIVDELKGSGVIQFGKTPTHTINIYKNRGNKWKMVRVWVHIDLGTLRTYDCFVTDYHDKLITNINPKKIIYKEKEETVVEHEDMPKVTQEQADEITTAIAEELPDAFNNIGEEKENTKNLFDFS